MPPIVKDLLLSKKFIVALLTAASTAAAYRGWNIDTTALIVLMTPFLVYIGAQGWADAGKEKAKVEQETALKAPGASLLMSSSAVQMLNSPAAQDVAAAEVVVSKTPQAGFTRIELAIALVVTLFTVFACALIPSCAHPKQTAVRLGQCVLDDGVLSEVLAALGKPGYVKLIEEAGLKHASDLIDCALQAIASQPDDQGAGSGSDTVGSVSRTAAEHTGADTLPRRAREVLEQRRAAGR